MSRSNTDVNTLLSYIFDTEKNHGKIKIIDLKKNLFLKTDKSNYKKSYLDGVKTVLSIDCRAGRLHETVANEAINKIDNAINNLIP